MTGSKGQPDDHPDSEPREDVASDAAADDAVPGGAGGQVGPFVPRSAETVASASSTDRDEAIFVPKHTDKWAHRRGEPRVFAFFWTLYLLGATLMGFSALGLVGGITAEVYRPVARGIIATVAIGATLLWPMTRLSQASPTRGGARAVRADMIVVLIPLQAVVWPQAILPAGWTPLSIGALAALCASWTVLVGGILAIALGGPRLDHPATRPAPPGSWFLMILLVVLVLAAPCMSMLMWRDGHLPDIRTEWLLSPVSGVFELTRNRVHTSLGPAMTALHWAIIAAPAAMGGVAWSIAAIRDQRRAIRWASRTAA